MPRGVTNLGALKGVVFLEGFMRDEKEKLSNKTQTKNEEQNPKAKVLVRSMYG
jgi:hypothetical protein